MRATFVERPPANPVPAVLAMLSIQMTKQEEYGRKAYPLPLEIKLWWKFKTNMAGLYAPAVTGKTSVHQSASP